MWGFNLIGPINANTWQGIFSRQVLSNLISDGYEVGYLDIRFGRDKEISKTVFPEFLKNSIEELPFDINLFLFEPKFVYQFVVQNFPCFNSKEKMNILLLDGLPFHYSEQLDFIFQKMDLVITPSPLIETIIRQIQIPPKLRLNSSIFTLNSIIQNKMYIPIENSFSFIFCCDFFSPTPDFSNTIECIKHILISFSNFSFDVKIKCFFHFELIELTPAQNNEIKLLSDYQNSKLEVVDANQNFDSYREALLNGDAYFSFEKMGGFEPAIIQFASQGKPIILIEGSSHFPFLNDSNCFFINLLDAKSDIESFANSWSFKSLDFEDAKFWFQKICTDILLRLKICEKTRQDCRKFLTNNNPNEIFSLIESVFKKTQIIKLFNDKASPVINSGSNKKSKLKLLFQNRSATYFLPGGDTVVMNQLWDEFKKLDVSIHFSASPKINLEGYDLVHLFNLIIPDLIDPMADNAIKSNVPYVMHGFQEKFSKYLIQSLAYTSIFNTYLNKGQPKGMLQELFQFGKNLKPFPDVTSAHAAKNAKVVFCCGEIEKKTILDLNPNANVVVVPYGASVSDSNIGSEIFINRFQVKDFVLCVGRLEARKNQLMLLSALEYDDIPIVFADGGITADLKYANLCKKFKRKGRTVFTGRLSNTELISAYRAAKVHCLPSWYELPGLVTIEAANYGCDVIASNWGSIQDYLNQYGSYIEPDDIENIRNQILVAYGRQVSPNLKARVADYSWEKCAKEVLHYYEKVVNER